MINKDDNMTIIAFYHYKRESCWKCV